MASYYVWSGATGGGTGADWANAYTTLTAAFSGKAAGSDFYVAHDHAETTAATITLTSNGTNAAPSKIVCVNRAGSVPPVSADKRATAQVSVTGAFVLRFNSYSHYDGIIFSSGSAANTGDIDIPASSGSAATFRFDNCSLRLANTNAASKINMGRSATFGSSVELNNTTVSFGAVGQTISLAALLKWRNTPSALLGTIPTTLFAPPSGMAGGVECVGVDLSAAGAGATLVGSNSSVWRTTYSFTDCKLDAAVTKSVVPASQGTAEIDFIRSGATGVNYAVYRHRMSGLLTEETTIVRTSGGASDGVTPLSWKVITTTNCSYSLPFDCPPIAIWNDTTGSAVTATVECIGAAIATDKEVWLEVSYLSDAGSPQGAFVTDAADILATAANQTSSSVTWGGSTAAFKLAATFTPQQKGWLYARVKCAKANSTFYVDPKVTLS